MSQYERNHDGAALGASHQGHVEDQRSVYPYTVQGGATIPDSSWTAKKQGMIHTTYLYLSVAVFGAMAGAYWGSHSEAFLNMMFSGGILMWLGLLFLINLVPHMALKVAHNSPRLAVPALAVDGFISGLVLAPLVFLGLQMSGQSTSEGGDLVSTALVITGAMFAAVTAYVHINKKTFKVSNAVAAGVLGFAVLAVPASMLFHSPVLSLVMAGLIGLLGVWQLAVATGRILNDPHFNDPAAGALMLFAGVFNIFQVVLRLLLAGGRD